MARHSLREPRYVPPPPPTIGAQPDLFGGPTITHQHQARPVASAKQMLAYHLADQLADLEGGQ